MTVRIKERNLRLVATGTTNLSLRVHTDPMDAGRRMAHFYPKRDLADPSVWWLVPWCSADRAYPLRHDRVEIDLAGFTDAEWCPVCTQRVLPSALTPLDPARLSRRMSGRL